MRGKNEFEKITKKKLVIILLITLILIASSIPLLFLMKNKETHHEVVTTYVVQKQPPFVFQGVVVPSKTQKEFYDSNINKLNSVNVTSDQEVKKGDILFSYKKANSDITSLEYALKRAELDVSSSQDFLITLKEKGNRLIEKINSYSSLSSNQSEIIDTGKQALLTEIETNNEQIRQTEQQLSRAYLAYDEAQENLDNAYNGQIVEIFAKQNGKVVLYDEYTANKPLLEIISFDSKVQAKVSEFDYPKLEMEEEVKIKTLNNVLVPKSWTNNY